MTSRTFPSICKRKAELGQSTLEFVVVTAAFLVIVIALAAVARMLTDGVAIDAAENRQPYAIELSEDAARYILMF